MADKAKKEILDVASILQSARERQKLTLDAVSREICVRSCFLKAIENRQFSDLPEMTFSVGFVRAYAKALRLDDLELANRFKDEFNAFHGDKTTDDAAADSEPAETPGSPNHPSSSGTPKKSADNTYQLNPAPKKRWPAWLSPVVGLVGAGMSWMFLGAQSATISTSAMIDPAAEDLILASLIEPQVSNSDLKTGGVPLEISAETIVDTTPEQAAGFDAASLFAPAAHASGFEPAGKKTNAIILEASEDSWIQLSYRDGTELWSGVLRAGQSYQPDLVGEVFLTTSNAGGIVLKRFDTLHGPLGERGDIVEALALNASLFAVESNVSSPLHAAGIGGND